MTLTPLDLASVTGVVSVVVVAGVEGGSKGNGVVSNPGVEEGGEGRKEGEGEEEEGEEGSETEEAEEDCE